MTAATEPACLELALADYPGMNPFVLDWMAGKVPSALLPRAAGEKGDDQRIRMVWPM